MKKLASKPKLVHFEVNNWISGRDYPAMEPFLSWMKDDLKLQLRDDAWAKENKLCVVVQSVDMSLNFCVTAEESWVQQNCPELLTGYRQFLVCPNSRGEYIGKFGDEFIEPPNYGVHESSYEDGVKNIEDDDFPPILSSDEDGESYSLYTQNDWFKAMVKQVFNVESAKPFVGTAEELVKLIQLAKTYLDAIGYPSSEWKGLLRK